MIVLGKPSNQIIKEFLSSQIDQPFSYKEIGMTRETKLIYPDYVTDHSRIHLGEGSAVFDRAVKGLRDWQHFKLSWLSICSGEIAIEPRSIVGLLIPLGPFSLLYACRIVYVINNEDNGIQKYGFAYGTLPQHAECGEERFTLEWNKLDNTVWYDILSFSHPNNFLIKIANPIARLVQKKFAHDSKLAMYAAMTI